MVGLGKGGRRIRFGTIRVNVRVDLRVDLRVKGRVRSVGINGISEMLHGKH